MKKVIILTCFFILLPALAFAAQGEIWLHVMENGVLKGNVTVQLYRQSENGYIYYGEGETTSTPGDGGGNIWLYYESQPIGGLEPPLPPFIEEQDYLIRINNRYCRISVGEITHCPDIEIDYEENTGVFSANELEQDIISLVTQGNWNSKTVVVKNSFSGGKLKIDSTLYTSVDANGISDSGRFGAPTFPHVLRAYDKQTNGNYTEKFVDWTGNQGFNNDSLITSIQAVSQNYTANFDEGFEVAFVNSVVDLGNVGTLKIDDDITNMPTSDKFVSVSESITAEGAGFIIDGIIYVIDHWTGGDSSYSHTFYPDDHETYTAYYKGIPQMTAISINSTETGQPVELTWSSHQNTNVTQFRVYRGAKVESNFTNPIVIATLSSSATSYTDYDYKIGGEDANSVAYDVVPYYSTEGTWGYVGMNIVSASPYMKLALKDGEVLTDYSISNYPNPFNPSTNINFKLPSKQVVRLSIYNILGEKITELINTRLDAGAYSVIWNGQNLYGSKVNSGIYFSVLETRERRLVQKMILTK